MGVAHGALNKRRQCMLSIPQDVALILRLLRQAGHLAYVVGGCVRDALLGLSLIHI